MTAMPSGGAPQRAERLLAAGEQLLREHFSDTANTLGAGYQFVSPTQVAARAGMSKGMLYHIWGRDGGKAFDNYIAELAERVINEYSLPDELRAAAKKLYDGGASWQQAIVLMSNFELDSQVHSTERRRAFLQSLSLCAYADCLPVGQSLHRSASESYELLGTFYEYALHLYGLRLRHPGGDGRPLTVVDLARTLSCVVEGFALEALHSPDVMEADIAWIVGDQPEPCSLFAIAMQSLVLALTEPIPDDER